jgi:hypothetical protein
MVVDVVQIKSIHNQNDQTFALDEKSSIKGINFNSISEDFVPIREGIAYKTPLTLDIPKDSESFKSPLCVPESSPNSNPDTLSDGLCSSHSPFKGVKNPKLSLTPVALRLDKTYENISNEKSSVESYNSPVKQKSPLKKKESNLSTSSSSMEIENLCFYDKTELDDLISQQAKPERHSKTRHRKSSSTSSLPLNQAITAGSNKKIFRSTSNRSMKAKQNSRSECSKSPQLDESTVSSNNSIRANVNHRNQLDLVQALAKDGISLPDSKTLIVSSRPSPSRIANPMTINSKSSDSSSYGSKSREDRNIMGDFHTTSGSIIVEDSFLATKSTDIRHSFLMTAKKAVSVGRSSFGSFRQDEAESTNITKPKSKKKIKNILKQISEKFTPAKSTSSLQGAISRVTSFDNETTRFKSSQNLLERRRNSDSDALPANRNRQNLNVSINTNSENEVETDNNNNENILNFGVRVQVRAVSKYKICSADPQGIEEEDTWAEVSGIFHQTFYIQSNCNGKLAMSDRLVTIQIDK